MAGSKIRFEWSRGAFRDVRTLPKVLEHLTETAEEWAEKAGPGYVADSHITGGRGRARASVRTGDLDSAIDNARNNTLMRILAGKAGLVEYVSKSGKKSYVTQKQADNYRRNRSG